jgi:hypothetical protein
MSIRDGSSEEVQIPTEARLASRRRCWRGEAVRITALPPFTEVKLSFLYPDRRTPRL